jgi:Ca2+-binding EF-hand superfamily protein
MREYDDDGTGEINFRKFCENVFNSKAGQADCVTKVKPRGMKNVVSSDAGTSDHFLRRKIRMAAKDLKLAFKARDTSGVGAIPVDEWRDVLQRYGMCSCLPAWLFPASLTEYLPHSGVQIST